MNTSGSIEQNACATYRIHKSYKFSSCTPTNELIRFPSIFDVNPLDKFIRPVSIANMDDSMLDGIILANSTMPGKR